MAADGGASSLKVSRDPPQHASHIGLRSLPRGRDPSQRHSCRARAQVVEQLPALSSSGLTFKPQLRTIGQHDGELPSPANLYRANHAVRHSRNVGTGGVAPRPCFEEMEVMLGDREKHLRRQACRPRVSALKRPNGGDLDRCVRQEVSPDEPRSAPQPSGGGAIAPWADKSDGIDGTAYALTNLLAGLLIADLLDLRTLGHLY